MLLQQSAVWCTVLCTPTAAVCCSIKRLSRVPQRCVLHPPSSLLFGPTPAGIPLLSAHVAVAKGADAAAVVQGVERLCRQSLGIEHTTIQPVPAGAAAGTRLESV